MRADLPVAWYVAGDRAPDGWQRIAASQASRPLAEALGLVPGRILVIRPDLHSAGQVAPDDLAGLLACYCARVTMEVKKDAAH
jgi:hypothetical protein